MKYKEKNLFFTGKGGVGKTSLACATAIALADEGARVLLVSTDPASNLDEVLGVELSSAAPRAVPGVPRLEALNLDPEASAREYRERVVGPYRGVLPAVAITSMEEQLSGACTVEIAAFDHFAHFLGDPERVASYDHVVFDTAPTGHTLRLLELPSAWTGFFEANTSGTSCLGPLQGLSAERALYAAALAALRDPAQTRVVLVARPEVPSLREAGRTAQELAALELRSLELILNGVFPGDAGDDPVAAAMARRADAALHALPLALHHLPRREILLQAEAPMGIAGLRRLMGGAPERWELTAWEALMDALAGPGHGVILTMGKGGVGKTSVAVRVARGLVARGHQVHLTTTDPAAHVLDLARSEGGLTVSRIDPREETARYTAHVLATAGAGLDQAGIALLEEDLRSPCTEEIAVFQAFAATVAEGTRGFVVIDTAPTGHTLLLLDAAEAYHREVLRKPGQSSSEAVRELLPRLRDPDFSRLLLVTLPEATPVHEAVQLQTDLARAGLQPFAWIINQALTGLPVTHPVLRERQRREARFIAEASAQSPRSVLLPWREDPIATEGA